jgi:CBS domain containing-hemolysin-like protein
MIVYFVIALAAQFIIAVGFASFGIASREHVEKAFPESLRWGSIARLMHRGRLHLMLALLGLEAIVLPWIASLVFRLFEGAGAETPLWRYGPLSVVAIAVAVVASSVAGFGLASANPVRWAVVASVPLFPVYLVARPLTELFLRAVSLVFPNLPREMASPFFLFPSAPGPEREGFIAETGSRLIHRIREFGVKKVRDVMVPRIDVFALDIHTPVEEVVGRVSAMGHSRVPLYDGSIDRIAGVLYVKDLLKIPPGATVRLDRGSLVREAYFVPEGKKIDDLLGEFQRGRKHLAVVVDEYGGTAGIVTLEDILEEIVGEIRDEYDVEAPLVRQIGPLQYAIAGRTSIDDLNSALGLALPSEEVDTLGGFLYNLVGRVPAEGEEILYGGVRFKIARLERRRIVEVIAWVPGSAAGTDSHGG